MNNNSETIFCHAVVKYYYNGNKNNPDNKMLFSRVTYAAIAPESPEKPITYAASWTCHKDNFRKDVGRSIAKRRLEGRLPGKICQVQIVGDDSDSLWTTVFGDSMSQGPNRWTIIDIRFWSKAFDTKEIVTAA